MSKDEPKTTDVLDTAANQTDLKENEIVNNDAVANTESANDEVLVTAPIDDTVTATSDELQEGKDKVADEKEATVKPAEDEGTKKEGTEKVEAGTKQELNKDQTTKDEDGESKVEVKNDVDAEEGDVTYPFTIRPIIPVTIFRGPSLSFAGRTFGGFMEIIGPSRDGFFPVSYVRAGLGRTTGYIQMTDEEVRKCRSWK